MAAVATTLMLSSCDKKPANDIKKEEINEKGNIRFSFDGAIGNASKAQTADEKKVTSLYAVVFNDAAGVAVNGKVGSASPSEKFYKLFNVLEHNGSTELKAGMDYFLKMEEDGHYYICFVANPGNEMTGKLKALTSASTIKDFKELVEDKVSPETKPGMLMTSAFIGLVSAKDKESKLNQIELKRAAARLDIVNKVEGVTVNKIIFNNIATKTVLIGKKKKDFNTDFLAANTEYADIKLNGKADGTAEFKEKIYSYEQYGAADKAPSLKISFTEGTDKNYDVIVEFKSLEGKKLINILRNTLYKLEITKEGEALKFTLATSSWSGDKAVKETKAEVVSTLIKNNDGKNDYSKTEAGDFMLKDGSTIKPDALTADKQADVIGIVAYMYKSENNARLRDGIKKALALKGVNTPHGLVLALKNASDKARWRRIFRAVSTTFSANSLKVIYNEGVDGYTLTKRITDKFSSQLEKEFPAFDAVVKFEEKVKSPETTTGWYMPSASEWIDILGDKGLNIVEKQDIDKVKEANEGEVGFDGMATKIKNRIYSKLEKVGELNYSKLERETCFWSSYEPKAEFAFIVTFIYTDAFVFSSKGVKNRGTVRTVLAF